MDAITREFWTRVDARNGTWLERHPVRAVVFAVLAVLVVVVLAAVAAS